MSDFDRMSKRVAMIDVPKPEPFDTTEYEGRVGAFTSGPSPRELPASGSLSASAEAEPKNANGAGELDWQKLAPARPAPPPPVSIGGRPSSAVVDSSSPLFGSLPDQVNASDRLSFRQPPSEPLSSSVSSGSLHYNPARQSAPQPLDMSDMFNSFQPTQPPPQVPQRLESAGYIPPSSSSSSSSSAPVSAPGSSAVPTTPSLFEEEALFIGGSDGAFLGPGLEGSDFLDPSLSTSSSSSSSSASTDPKVLSASLIEYEKHREKARTTDFSKIEPLKVIYTAGHDSEGRPIVVVVASHLNVKKTDLDTLLLYTIHILDPIVDKDYVLVFIGTHFSRDNRPSLAWFRKAYSILNRKFKKNLKMLYIVHAAWGIKAALNLFRPFVSNKFWRKVVLVDDLSDIYKTIGRSEIWIPDFVITYNAKHNKHKPIFGVPLEEVLNIEHSKTGIPQVIIESVNYLSYHYDVEGIFRKSGEARLIDEIRKAYDKGEDVELTTAIQDPHAVSGLLKLFLRELPNPVIPFDLYDLILQSHQASASNDEVWRHVMKGLLSSLPKANYALLEYLFSMMQEVSKYSDKNLMTTSNLAIVFAPNLLRLGDESDLLSVMRDTPIVNSAIKKIIENFTFLFPNPPSVPNNTNPSAALSPR
eukprot:TRINITY_DN811_c0_g1_i1.p1 TRINITY_DN811_c0_g1~~TRINITY_DN811_c0_g1_i1.p1  ORF type:complete len:699 (+),score=279.74 TRINITY_DN811_c0_g1_i1:174-2099(+)